MITVPSRMLLFLGILGVLGCDKQKQSGEGAESAVALPTDSASASAHNAVHKSVAEKVVVQSAGVKEGDLVLVVGSDEDLPLLEDMAVEVSKRGGTALVSVGTQQLNRRLYDEVPAKFDSQEPEMTLKLAGIVDVIITTEPNEGRTLKGVPAARIAARAKAAAPIAQLMRKRGVRTVALGNGLYPTAERAEQFGVSREDLATMMYGGVDADYTSLQATGEQVRKTLASGRELRITNTNGTDLKVGISGRSVSVNDGIISAEENKKGGAATSVWLPAGEVYLTPVPGTATGTFIVDRFFFQGKPIEALRLEFKAGRLTSMTAKGGLEALQAAYEAAGAGKDLLGVIDVGINRSIESPERSPVHVWGKAGTVTVVTGGNTWAGGDNEANFAFATHSPGSTLTVDGKPLVQDGKLVITERVADR